MWEIKALRQSSRPSHRVRRLFEDPLLDAKFEHWSLVSDLYPRILFADLWYPVTNGFFPPRFFCSFPQITLSGLHLKFVFMLNDMIYSLIKKVQKTTSNNTDQAKAVVLYAFIRILNLDKAGRKMKISPNLLVSKYTSIVGHSHFSSGCFGTPFS